MDVKSERSKQANKQVLVVGLVIVLASILFLGWKFIFSEPDNNMIVMPKIREAPQIDFDFLETSEFQNFERYQKIGEINFIDERELGRDNPFMPY